jgi:hypothetical protein
VVGWGMLKKNVKRKMLKVKQLLQKFSHVKVPKKKIPMNVPIDVTSIVEKENPVARSDGNDI